MERAIPRPRPQEVRIRVEACGVCHSDSLVKEGDWLGLKYPRVPGHEIAGKIDAVGEAIRIWKVGRGVEVGWHGGHCFECNACRRGYFILSQFGKITGVSHDGGIAAFMISPAEAVAALPESMAATDVGPSLCAGITVFSSLRHFGARAGDVVAVHGVGGLGHLAIQFAGRMGFVTVTLARRGEKEHWPKNWERRITSIHRRPIRLPNFRCEGGTCYLRDCAQRQSDFLSRGSVVERRKAFNCRCGSRVAQHKCLRSYRRSEKRSGLAIRDGQRLGGYA